MLTHARQAAATSPLLQPGARALYLGTRDKKNVTCTDQALVVHNALKQIRRYPLERISRVVSSAVTDWSGSALMLCLRHGIGITWLDGKGNALGTCYPAQRRYPAFATAIELLTETPQGLERYNNWLRSRRMDVLLRWGKDFAQVISPGQWEAARRSWVYAGQFEEHLAAPLRGHSLAWVGAQLAAHGLQPLLWSPTAQAIDLENDLCTLIWAEMNLCAGSLANSIQNEESITTLFERWNARNGSALLLHITSLSRTAMKAHTTRGHHHVTKSMSNNQTVPWLVIYDIADPNRLARVFKALKKVGVPVQYSVFSVDASAMGMANLMAQLALLIQPKGDDIRAYRLPENGWRATLGHTMLPEGIWLV